MIIYLLVPKFSGTDSVPGTLADQIGRFWQIFRNRVFWRIALLTVASQCAFLGTQSLWSGPWLKDVAGMPRDAVAVALFLILCSMVTGFLGLGVIVDRLSRFGVKPINVALVGMAGFVIVQACLVAQWTEAAIPLWMLYELFGTTGILPYAVLPAYFTANFTGRVITGLNFLVFFAGGAEYTTIRA